MEGEHVKISIPKFYKRSALDHLMFGFVQGVRTALPTLSIRECLVLFHKKTGEDDYSYPIESAKSAYTRMQQEFLQKGAICSRTEL